MASSRFEFCWLHFHSGRPDSPARLSVAHAAKSDEGYDDGVFYEFTITWEPAPGDRAPLGSHSPAHTPSWPVVRVHAEAFPAFVEHRALFDGLAVLREVHRMRGIPTAQVTQLLLRLGYVDVTDYS